MNFPPQLLCLVLCIAGTASAQELAARQQAVLAAQLARIEASRPGETELYLLAAGLNDEQDVFKNDVQSLRDLFDRHWRTRNRSVALIADESTRDAYAYPTRDNLRRAGEALAGKLDPKKDVLLLFLTSHGTTRGLRASLPDKSKFMFSAVDVRKLAESTGATYRVVILSACHSGALMGELQDERTLVITAAHASRASFGCDFKYLHTWFSQALVEALAAEPRFEQAFQAAAEWIRQREQDGDAYEHSMPQIHVGSAIRAKLAQVEARARAAPGWQPPVLSTQAGKLRQLLGDYLSVAHGKGAEASIRWLQLRKVGTPVNGTYPIDAWALHLYRAQGELKASYDPATKLLSASSASLGEVRLKLEGARLVGTMQRTSDKAAPAELSFDRVLRREVFETRAQHPLPRMRADASSRIRLLYLSAADCPKCRAWERDHLEGKRLTGMPEYAKIEFVTAKRAAAKDRLKKGDLPEGLAFLHDKLESDKGYAPLLADVPAFALLVNDQVRAWATGPFLDSPIYPVLRAAVREKTAGAVK